MALIYFQLNSFPAEETARMDFPSQDRAIWATRQMLKEFPHSRYGDDALLVLADLTRNEKYAREAIRRFPHGDLIESGSR